MMNRVAVIGVGLIGGSLMLALKRAGYCQHVTGYDLHQADLVKAVELGVIDSYAASLAEAVNGADMVVVAVPMGAMPAVFRELGSCLPESTIVTDVGSAKASVVAAAHEYLGARVTNFVAGHPIAGTEHSGVEAAFAELYNQRRVILTPEAITSPHALDRVRAMWRSAGAIVEEMAVEQHDDILAATSHLPHILAYNLINTLINIDKSEQIFRFSAGGFRDFTRIASSNPRMWHDILLANRQSVLKVIDQYMADLAELKHAIANEDGQYLLEAFTRAKQARDRHIVK